MAVGVLMPKAGITVEQCVITRWEKQVGDTVAEGDVLFSYETDKAAFECESTASGVILAIFYAEGEEVPVLVNVCAVGQPGEDFSSLAPAAGQTAGAASPAAAPAQIQAAPEEVPGSVYAPAQADGILRSSPRARNLAEKAGVNPAQAIPSGPDGRVIERDIAALINAQEAPGDLAVPQAPAVLTAPNGEKIGFADTVFGNLRKAVAAAMTASISNSAQLTHHHSFDATELLALRARFKAGGDEALEGVTINDIILFAVSRVLERHSDFNAYMLDAGTIRHFDHVHLGVATDTPRGLMVPTVFFADTLNVREISAEVKRLAALAKQGTINPDYLKGGSFTVSNLGAYGVEMFTPIINPPQTAILGVCSIVTRLKGEKEQYKPYPAMGLSITYDHRATDGAAEARFAADLCGMLENISQHISV